jgi:serine/threonine protein kinase
MDPDRSLPEEIGRYRVVRLLGQGAMGRVLLAHDPVLDRDVAVKLLRDDLGLPSEQRQALLDRMRQEARASARVSHPAIVALHDMGEHAELGLFLVFEYAEGTTVKERLTRGALPADAVAKIARPVGSALATAHEAGVLHRDIKPENIILTKNGPKVADFGIARVPDSTLTRDGGLLGTPAYSAPEAIADGAFSPASDQFSLAATLWEALSGRRAFPGDDAVSVASRIATDEPPKIAELCGLDPHVDTVLARGLSKNPRGRFDSCLEFGETLAEALEITPRGARPTVPDRLHREEQIQQQLGGGYGKRWVRVAVGGATVGALVVAAGYQVTRELGPEPPRPLPEIPAATERDAEVDAQPVGYLAESPTKKKRTRPKPSIVDAGVDADPSDASPDAALEAGAVETDAGDEQEDDGGTP